MVALQKRMLEKLKGEGYSGLELLAVTYPKEVTWEYHATGFEQVTFPVMPDKTGVSYLYGAQVYDFFWVDKKGMLAGKVSNFSDSQIESVNAKLRELLK